MTTTLLIAGLILLVTILAVQLLLLRRKVAFDLSPVQEAFRMVEASYERSERAVREEIRKNRGEISTSLGQSRDELTKSLKSLTETLNRQLGAFVQSNAQKLDQMRDSVQQRLQLIQEENGKKLEQVRQDSLSNAKALREEVGTTLKGFNESLIGNLGEIGKLQKAQLDVFSERLDKLTTTNEQRIAAMREIIEQRLSTMQEDNGKKLDQMRQESTSSAQKAREEVVASLKLFSDALTKTLDDMSGKQRTQLGVVVEELNKLTGTTDKKLDAQRTGIDERLRQIQTDSVENAKSMREEVGTSLKGFNDSVLKGMTGMAEAQRNQMEAFSNQLGNLITSNQEKLDALRTAVEEKLKLLQEDNSKSLEQMRLTVDEKLQGTLDKRLGESFTLVSERLEAVSRGIGEMQVLATGVGDLKKVLTNVRTRGTWGEVQLEAMLEQILTNDQYEKNVATKDGGERVEFCIKLPGRGEDKDEIVWLAIDAKFPIEDYTRLIDAQERGDLAAVEEASKQLENRIKACACTICDKYLNPPKTTDFAILYLPTEGLFAEVIRRLGLAEFVQRENRVVIAGPTTLWSILNALQMGFRTLTIQKRSSEVWNLLAAVKTEWTKYGDVLAKVQKKLQEASNTIDNAERRTRAIGRKLKGVEALPTAAAAAVLMLEGGHADGDGEVEESKPA
jgi:DNA recombination protein RmuC